MRKILFRGWDTKEKKMLDWMGFADALKDAIPYDAGDEWTEQCILMQYTGVNTLDGTEIYEGDIISNPEGIYADGKVEFCCGAFGVFLEYDTIFMPFSEFNREAIERVEIIGNAYEQPEFLQPPQ
jgi:hypothetical protein